MDVGALALNIDSSKVVKAANDLDRFAAAAAKAGAATGNPTGSIAKLVATIQSMDAKLGQLVTGLNRANAALSVNSAAAGRAAASNDNQANALRRSAQAALESAAAQQRASSASSDLASTQAVLAARLTALASVQQQASNAMRQANAHVLAYRDHLASIPPAAQKAQDSVQRLGRRAADSASAMKANTGNIAAQFQDIGVTAAMGMNPMLIALQQGTQLSAVLAQTGGTAMETLSAAFASVVSPVSLLTIAIVAGAAALIQWAMSATSASDESEKLAKKFDQVKWATDAVGEAQTILGNYMDITTGKITTQSAALRDLALAQAMVAKVKAQIAQEDARSQMAEMTRRRWGVSGGFGGGLGVQSFYTPESGIVEAFTKGEMKADTALKQLERLKDMGQLSKEAFLDAAAAIANFNVETERIAKFDELSRGIAGESGLLSQFMKLNKTRTRHGKTDAERLADLVRGAKEAITAEENRAKAVELSAYATAELEQKTTLLNKAASAGVKVTPALSAEIDKLADAYAKAKVNADISETVKGITHDIENQQAAVEDQIKLIGLYGEALARARREQEAQRTLRENTPKGEIVVLGNLTGGLSNDIERANRLQRLEDIRKASKDAAYAMNLEAGALGLTGKALIAYNYAAEQKLKYQRDGITLSPAEIALIDKTADAYARQRYAIDQTQQKIADAREVTKGFWLDLINGAREGANAFAALGNAAVNALNRIIDKLLDRTLDNFLNSLMPGGMTAGGIARSNATVAATMNANAGIFAKGGTFGTAQRFANGGAFTNSVVSTPTLFRFANGGKVGEMGEAGPEAIMPLKRGPNGALGVQVHGGGKPNVNISAPVYITQSGSFTTQDAQAMALQAGQSAVDQVKKNLNSYMEEWQANGAVAV
ncbi:phage tail length tape measure family protein [Croceibacterium aestuarii]|uniref:phage tail length tape measure family protein n=1 Tax=Croceibacterium aestuarii TaxID=3064139 RepID=UPI00272E0FAE|nr:phage tail length tape measure family protein [Croceibacterium sp. D39]